MGGDQMNIFRLPEAKNVRKSLIFFIRLKIMIERIISTGQASPEGFWYDQDFDEWVVVLREVRSCLGRWKNAEMGPGTGS